MAVVVSETIFGRGVESTDRLGAQEEQQMKKKRSTQVVSSLLALAVSVMVLTLVLACLTDHSVQAGPPGQRRERRTVSPPKNRWRFRSVRGLHRTAVYTPPPDGPRYDPLHGPPPCNGVVVARGAQFWMVYPTPDPEGDIDIFLDDPFDWPGIAVWICGSDGDSEISYALSGPDGENESTFPLEPALPTGATDETEAYAYVYEFLQACGEGEEPPDCSLPGVYTLTIRSGLVEFPAIEFRVVSYPGPRIEAEEVQAAETGQALEVQYVGFDDAEGSIRACLYHDVEGFVKGWEIPPDPDDGYRSVLLITDEMAKGEYTLIGVPDVAISCPPILDELAVAYLAGQDPPAAYWRFALGLEEEMRGQLEEQPVTVYFDLGWAPGCDPDRPLALQLPGHGSCGLEVERRDMDWLTDELRKLGLLEADEWLEVVPLRPWWGQALAVRGEGNGQLGWIRVGGSWPGSVWRTTYYAPAKQVGRRCWLGSGYVWVCEE